MVEFTAHNGTELIDSMRGGCTAKAKSRQPETPRPSLRAGRDVNAPAVLRRIEPAAGTGSVIVDVWIDRGGFVRDAALVRELGQGLSDAALEAVQQWRFEPSLLNDVPVEVVYEVTVEFRP